MDTNHADEVQASFESARAELSSITTLLAQGTDSLTQRMEFHATVFNELCSDDSLGAIAKIQAAVAEVLRDISMYSVFFVSFPVRLNCAATRLVDSAGEIAAAMVVTSEGEREEASGLRDTLASLQQNTEFALHAAVGYRNSLTALAATGLSEDIDDTVRNEEAVLAPMIADMENVNTFCTETIMLLNLKLQL